MHWQLVRIDPPERRGEVLTLDAALGRHLLGRSTECDLTLHTATASRRHAELRRREDGSWIVEPCGGRELLADGEVVEGAMELCEGLSITLGGDRLRCRRVDSVVPEVEIAAAAASAPLGGARRWSIIAGLAILLAIGAILRSGCGA